MVIAEKQKSNIGFDFMMILRIINLGLGKDHVALILVYKNTTSKRQGFPVEDTPVLNPGKALIGGFSNKANNGTPPDPFESLRNLEMWAAIERSGTRLEILRKKEEALS